MNELKPPTKKEPKKHRSPVPAVCPKCSRPIRKFRTVQANVLGAQVKKLEPAHFHLTFAGVCGGMHLHVCAACGDRSTTVDPKCTWQEPNKLEPGWTAAKASQCDYETATASDSEDKAPPK